MKIRTKTVILICIALLTMFILTGCIPGSDAYHSERPANFLSGIWHGWIAPISLIVGLFKPHIRIYEAVNTGWTYDIGFYIAIISGFGGISISRNKRKKK